MTPQDYENAKAERNYIGREEAYEIMLGWGGGWRLPRKGVERLNVPAIASGIPVEVIGHDENGYYYFSIENK